MKNPKLLKKFGSKPVVWVPMWGLSKLRKRGGRFAGNVPGDALWYDEWYARAMSRETAEKLAELGVNLVIPPFSVGASHEAESFERDDFQRFTEHLHEFGIASLPYLQYQNFLQEEHAPDDVTWAVALDGSRQQYNYWRRTACQSGIAFKRYYDQLFEDAVKRGADGIWIDNNYLKPCRCERCQAAFKAYLRENRGDLLAELYLTDFDAVEIPPSLANVADPIVQAYIDFNCQRNMDDQRRLKDKLESLSPDALFASNPGIYRGRSYAAAGVDVHGMLSLYDLMYLENKFFPMREIGQTSGNFHGVIAGEAVESLGVPGCWKRPDFDDTDDKPYHGMVDTPSEIDRVILESVSVGGAVGMLWAVRTRPREYCEGIDDLKSMYFETPAIHAAMKNALDYVRELSVFGESTSLANVGILHHRQTLKFDFDAHWAGIHGVEELLRVNAIPHRAVFSEDLPEALDGVKLLILPNVTILNDEEAEMIREFVKNGGNCLALGDVGLYDSRRRVREEYLLADLLGVSSFNSSQEMVRHSFGSGSTAFLRGSGGAGDAYVNMMGGNSEMVKPNWLKDPSPVLETVRSLLEGSGVPRLESAPEGLSVGVKETADGRKVIQLFSYESDPKPETFDLVLDAEVFPSQGELFVFGSGKSEAKGETRNGEVVFAIANFTRHAALVLK